MWRGSAFSGLIHGGLFAVFLFGLPSLPEIFDRGAPAEGIDIPIPVEIVAAETTDLRHFVLAADIRDNAVASTSAEIPSFVPGDSPNPAAPPRRTDMPAGIAAAKDSAFAGEDRSGETVRIPTGKPENSEARPSQRTRSDSPDLDPDRQPPPAVPAPARVSAPPTDAPKPATPTPAAVHTAPADPDQAAGPPGHQRGTSGTPGTAAAALPETGAPRVPEAEPQAKAAIAAIAAVSPSEAGLPAQHAPATGQPGSAATGGRPSPMERAQNRVEPLPPATDGGVPAHTASAAAASALPESEFLDAVGGPQRELVLQLLAEDRRLRDAILPRAAAEDIPAEAQRRTLERLRQAADGGFPHAQYNLAVKLLRGEDVARDPDQAQKRLNKAAEQGYAPAQMLVGLMRFTGVGLPRDLAEASFWWSLAARREYEPAKLGNDLLKPFLKPDEVVKANRLRARWGSLINDLAAATERNSVREANKALQAAAEQGDVEAVLAMLAHGADADSMGEDGRNAVINAAWRGRSQIVRILLQRGAATELSDDRERTPLLWAAINGHAEVVSELVASGANPNHRDASGTTPLIRAAWNGHTDVVRMLVESGARLDARDESGLTALARARNEGHAAIVGLLRDAGAR